MNKKKLALGIVGGLLVLLILAVIIVAAKLDTIVKAGIQTVGPKLTKTTIEVKSVSIHPFIGSGAIGGLVVGTPAGYKAEYTMKMDQAQLAIKPGSLLSDKVVIDDITVEAPEIILEGGLKENNLTAIQKNVTDSVGGGSAAPGKPATPAPASGGATKKLQVNHFKLAGAKVHLRLSMLAGKNVTIPAPTIELKDLGTGPDGITVAELVKQTMDKFIPEILTAAEQSVAKLGKEAADVAGKAATDAVGAASKEGSKAVDKAAEGLKSLFKKQ
jgi:hypothetical protein